MRVTWQIVPDVSAQMSWAHVVSPEQLEPDVNLIQKSVSLAYDHSFNAGTLASTLAFGRKIVTGDDKPSDALLFENTFRFNASWLGLLRHERVYNDEPVPGAARWVAKTEIGLVRQFNILPDALRSVYGGHPGGTVAFLRLTQNWMPGMDGMTM